MDASLGLNGGCTPVVSPLEHFSSFHNFSNYYSIILYIRPSFGVFLVVFLLSSGDFVPAKQDNPVLAVEIDASDIP